MNPLFDTPLRRADLLSLPVAEAARPITIAVHRNHAFELVASVLNPFLALSGLRAEFVYDGWDDSLSFCSPLQEADLHLMWIDGTRYAMPDFSDWLRERAVTLRDATGKEVLVGCCGASGGELAPLPDILFLDCDAVISPLGAGAYDTRLEPFSGTRLTDQACLVLARELGTRQIPALLFPPLKVLAVDLDNTLHEGVLGEDGPYGLVPHLALQRHLAHLARQGFLLALVSKNEEADVRRLFAVRPDFALQWQDFTAHAIGWGPKARAIEKLAAELRVGLDSVLFIDDNPGERLAVSRSLPEVHVLPADSAEEMLAALTHYPGLYRVRSAGEDVLRSDDLKANRLRSSLRRTLSAEEYMAQLGMELDFAVNDMAAVDRVRELLRKTNQWVLALARPGAGVVAGYASCPDRCMVTACMRDRLSESGMIAAGLFRAEQNRLRVDELAISCRALGRGVENGMLRAMLLLARERLQTGPEITVAYRQGPRNQPAREWLSGLTDEPLAEAGVARLAALPSDTLPQVSIRRPDAS